MIKSEREQQILNLLKENGGFITVNKLCELLYASKSSIRRDLQRLQNRGDVKRCYGGAELIGNFSGAIPFDYRYKLNEQAKSIIAEKAVKLIKENSIIYLDQSSSAYYLALKLPNLRSLTVVTNNVEILSLLSRTNITVISSGGTLSAENRSCLLGYDAIKTFESMRADIAFFSSKSLSLSGVVSDVDREEVHLRHSIINNAEKVAFLCDTSKFGSNSAYKQCSLSDVDYLITEDKNYFIFDPKFKNIKML